MTVEDDDTMIPIKDVIANPIGMVNNWDQRASLGFLANREKSGSLLKRSEPQRSEWLELKLTQSE